MKKKVTKKRLLCTWVLLVMYLLGIGACAPSVDTDVPDAEQTSASLPETTESLTIYRGPYLADITDVAVQIYKERFPNVKVDYVSFGDYDEDQSYLTFSNTLINDLSAGKGPDVVMWNWEFPDIYKVMQSGLFENLDPYFEGDAEISLDDYVGGVMDGGVYRGERLFVPLNYHIGMLLSSEKTLEDFGFQIPEQASLADWRDAFVSHAQQVKEQKATYTNIYGYSNEFILFRMSKVPALDYDEGRVLIDNEYFRQLMEINKIFYDQVSETYDPEWGVNRVYWTGDEVISVRDKKTLFSYGSSPNEWALMCSGILDSSTPVYFSMPNIDTEGAVAEIAQSAAIRKNSENKKNAFEFIKILLSLRAQTEGNPYGQYFPVQKSALETVIMRNVREARNYGAPDGSVLFREIPQDMVDQFIRFSIDARYTPNDVQSLVGFVGDSMHAFLLGDKTYESCLAELENKLELYIYE